MKILRRMSRRLKVILLGVLVVLIAGAGFLAYRISFYGYPSEFSLYTMAADGTDPKELVRLRSVDGSPPNWAPDGRSMVFEAQGDIYSLDTKSSQTTRLTTASELDFTPIFSPDGKTIAFTSDRGGRTGIYLMSVEGSNERALSTEDDIGPSWSPDGSQLVFDSGRQGGPGLYTINADGTGLRRLTQGRHYSTGQGSSDYAPDWSPDGASIAFVSNRTGQNEVYVMKASGSGQRRLTKTKTNVEAMAPAWSPDGSKIALMSGLGKAREIYLMNADGSELRRITTNREYDGSPTWSPDGSRIGFVSTRGL